MVSLREPGTDETREQVSIELISKHKRFLGVCARKARAAARQYAIRQITSATSSELVRLVKETCERWGQDMELAPKLPFYFIEARIGTLNGTDINLPMTSFESFTVHHRDLCRNLLPKATTIFGALAGDDRGVET